MNYNYIALQNGATVGLLPGLNIIDVAGGSIAAANFLVPENLPGGTVIAIRFTGTIIAASWSGAAIPAYQVGLTSPVAGTFVEMVSVTEVGALL